MSNTQLTPGYIQRFETVHGDQPVYFANKQCKLAGPILELKKYYKHFPMSRIPKTPSLIKKGKKVYSQEEIKKRVYLRARTRVRDYVNANIGQYKKQSGTPYRSLFVTLTFASNLTDLDVAHSVFRSFIKSFSTRLFGGRSDLRYLSVVEFQTRGAIHYHVLFFNVPFRSDLKRLLAQYWTAGMANVRGVNGVRNVGRYISKYLSKDFDSFVYASRKSYFVSRNLFKPLVVNYDEIISRVMDPIPVEALEYQKIGIPLDFLAGMDYFQYDLTDDQDIQKLVAQYFDA